MNLVSLMTMWCNTKWNMTSTQGVYQFEFDDWSGDIDTINPNTGLVTFINSDNQAGVSAITNTTTFSQTSNPDPDPGEFFHQQLTLEEIISFGKRGQLLLL